MAADKSSSLPAMTRRGFVATAGTAILGALALGALRKAEPAVAAVAPLARPDALGTSAGRCAHCGSTAHMSLSPACEAGAAPRRALQGEARRRVAASRRAAR